MQHTSAPSSNNSTHVNSFGLYTTGPGAAAANGNGFGVQPDAGVGLNPQYSPSGHQMGELEQMAWDRSGMVTLNGQATMQNMAHLESDPEPTPEAMLAAMVDSICTQFGLDEDHIATLYLFVEITDGLTIPDRISRVFMTAATLKVSMGIGPRESQFTAILEDLKAIKEEFEAHFILSEDQKMVVRVYAHEEIFKPKRMDFMTMHLDVLHRIMENRKDLGFTPVFKSPARESCLGSYNKTYSSGLRNQYRISYRDGATVGHKSAVNIIKFTMDMAEKYQRGGASAVYTLDNEHTLKCALLRYIALQNKELLGIPEPSKQGSRGDSSEPADTPVNEESGKRKRQNGRPKDDDHFWSIASKFLEDKEEELGKPFKTEGWVRFMNKVLNEDMALFGRPPEKELARTARASAAPAPPSVPATPAPGTQARAAPAHSTLLSLYKRSTQAAAPGGGPMPFA